MRRQIIATVKSALRPIVKHRFLIEKIKYRGQTILGSQAGNELLAQLVHKPGAAGKIGGTEMRLCRVYLRRRDAADVCHSFGPYALWAYQNAGVYPNDPVTLSRFCREFLAELQHLNLLGVWFNFGEANARRTYAPQATLAEVKALEPYYYQRPWSAQLAGKRVLVVTPFARSVESQYQRRKDVWARKPDLLPEFDLRVVRCQQIAGLLSEKEYPDWFTGLASLKEQMAAKPFDVALIGAGAWSIPLATHAKSLGAFGIHLGGGLQLMFGIMGRRWESNPQINALKTDAWTRPSDDERPQKMLLTENGCYW
ncbi:MAG: hypothetical protein ABSH22_22915 [Tepidisphaeraceae bacterium]|jgi:hypothetical protein